MLVLKECQSIFCSEQEMEGAKIIQNHTSGSAVEGRYSALNALHGVVNSLLLVSGISSE